MNSRHIFRMVYYKNIAQFIHDNHVLAKNHTPIQKGYRISYNEIVNRRDGDEFRTPDDHVVNDFVPFYFSPITAMAYTIHSGNVSLIDPVGENLGRADMQDVVFLVCSPGKLQTAGLDFWFTDIACNSTAVLPEYLNDLSRLEEHIDWVLFDETPLKGLVKEIGYKGACKYFNDRDEPERYKNRKRKRMAEFLIKDALPFHLVDCIVTYKKGIKTEIETWMQESDSPVPVYVKRGCYF